MGKHRTKLAILANILSVINNDKGARKTRIMYKAYLSYGLLTRYLKNVIDAKLVTCEEKNCYKLTHKGKKFIVTLRNQTGLERMRISTLYFGGKEK